MDEGMKVVKTTKTLGSCPKCGRKEALRLYDTVDVETNNLMKAALCVCGWTFDAEASHLEQVQRRLFNMDAEPVYRSRPVIDVSFPGLPDEAQITKIKKTLLGTIMNRQCANGREHNWRPHHAPTIGRFVRCIECGYCQDFEGNQIIPLGLDLNDPRDH